MIEESEETRNQIPILRTIKYSGNKIRLLPIIVRLVNYIIKPGGRILDLMAGTHCIGYALKNRYQVYANDIQDYSYTIGKAFIENGGYSIDKEQAKNDLSLNIIKNSRIKKFNLFQENYPGTYFTRAQCVEIDNIRAAIDCTSSPRKEFYLSMLMTAMCLTSNTTGHFAEFLRKPPAKPRSIEKLFFIRCENSAVNPSPFPNSVFNLNYKDFFYEPKLVSILVGSNLIYLDPPYSQAQYSRFYHILETVVKYDYPLIEFKGRYRKERYFSNFCRKSKAQKELDQTLKRLSELNKHFVLLSYVDSSSCLIPKDTFQETVENYFEYTTKPLTCSISHSRLGNGSSKSVIEYLILATNSKKGKIIVDRLNRACIRV